MLRCSYIHPLKCNLFFSDRTAGAVVGAVVGAVQSPYPEKGWYAKQVALTFRVRGKEH